MKTPLDSYECRHGLGYTKISSLKNGVESSQLAYVPLGMNAEVHVIKLKNTTSDTKNLKLFSYFEFCLWDAWDDQTNFQRNYSTGQVAIEENFIFHITEYRERRNHYAYVWCSEDIAGYDTDRESFLGLYNGPEAPQAVAEGSSANSIAHGWAPIASQSVEVELHAGEEKEIIFVLGYEENEETDKFRNGKPNFEKAYRSAVKFLCEGIVAIQIAKLKQYWDDVLSVYSIESSDKKLNTMVNIWNQYQCMVTFHMSRSASFFESGVGRGMGFRDSNQDILGFVHQIPEKARERLIDLAATQFSDGSVYHQYQPLTKKGNADIGGGFNDDPLWLILSVITYIKESGDFSILTEKVKFEDKEDAKMMDHLFASFNHVVENKGPHGLPLIGRADWNDCLNLNCHSTQPGQSFQTYGTADGRVAESVMIAGLFIYAADMMEELLQKTGDAKGRKYVKDEAAKVLSAVDEHGWDGEWFLRAYDAYGSKVGSSECEEGKIFIESQGLCVMAGIGLDDGRAQKAMQSVEDYLETEHGVVLQQPAYSKYYENLGEISSYPPGYKENAGIFCHNNSWITCAQAKLGMGDAAFRTYSKIAPAYIKDQNLHKTEPYVYSQMIAGRDAATFGEAKNSWLTGTASWCFVAVSQWILGIYPEYDGLRIDPCLPKHLKEYTVRRKFRSTEYVIHVLNPDNAQKGVKSIKADGMTIKGNVVPISEKDKVLLEVVM
jgi:cellobiose phosphorylase